MAEFRTRIERGVAVITISQPERLNALTGAMYGYQGEEDAVIFPLKARSFRLLATYSPY